MENIEEIVERFNQWNEEGRFAEVNAEVSTLLTTVLDDDDADDVASLYVLKGNAEYGLGRFEDALKSYAKAIEFDTFDVQARCNYGTTLYTLGRYVDALNALDAAILTDEEFTPAYINVAHCLVALKHEEEAIYALQQAFNLDKNDANLGRTVADMATDLENFEVALETYIETARLPDTQEDIFEATYNMFVKFKNHSDVPQNEWLDGINKWRTAFPTNPEVIRLTSELMRG